MDDSLSAAPLSDEARAVVAEEEALLARALAALAAVPVSKGRDNAALVDQLKALRDEAMSASAADMPALFQEMGSVRGLLETEQSRALPNAQTPYFAHLRLRGAKGVRDYLLGRATFIDATSGIRIVDWRFAPVARIFYRYQAGDDFEEELPGGLSEGVVEARRVVVVERGELTKIIDGPRVLARENGEWRDVGHGQGLLAGGAGTAARPGTLGLGAATTTHDGRADITALLDSEQFEALSIDASRPLLVLGSAGSGKTTVALHRLAKLAFDDRERFSERRLRVVVPEPGLARLSRRLLEPLGLGRVKVETLDDWTYSAALVAFALPSIKVCRDPPSLVSSFKKHPALRGPLLERLGRLPRSALAFTSLRRRLAELYTDRAFVASIVEASNGALSLPTIDQLVRHTMLQLATPADAQYRGIDAERLQAIDGGSMDEGTPEELAGTVDVEDLPIFMWIRAINGDLPIEEPLSHLVLDEAEDFTLYEAGSLAENLDEDGSFTLSGDEMQQTNTAFAGWPAMLAAMGAKDPATCRLEVSYRCPRPVVELAQRVLGAQAPVAPARPGRDGAPVGFHHFPDDAQAQLFLATALRDLGDREPQASVGVIASTPEAAKATYQALEGLSHSRLVLDGNFSFEPGIDVTDVESTKGLEFDYVIVPDASARAYPAQDEARRRLHVAVTRTSHQLWILSSGRRTPLLEGAEP